MLKGLRTLGISSILALGLTAGCAVDGQQEEEEIAPEELVAEFGIGSGENFHVFQENETCHVSYFSQGGYFTMFTIHANVPVETFVTCGLEIGDMKTDSVTGADVWEPVLVTEQSLLMKQGTTSVLGSVALGVFPGEPDRAAEIDGKSGVLYCDFEGNIISLPVVMQVNFFEPEPDGLPRDVEEVSSATIAR